MSKQLRRLLSTIAVQKSLENVRKICLMVYQTQEKFPKIISSHFVHSLRLLSILARQKSTENKRKICLMIYQNRENFQKIIPNRLKHMKRLFFDESVSKIDQQRLNYMSDDISEPGKISKNYSEPFKAY